MEHRTETLLTCGGNITCTRCHATSKRTGAQCGRPAMRDKEVCDFHGGKSTGPKTEAGKARIAAALTVHGRETREQRAERSAASARISQLEDAMHVLKMTTAPWTRGRKATGYTPITSIEGVVQMIIDDLLHRNTGVKDLG